MTPTEMRQQAARNRAHAAALDSAAARVRVIADEIRPLLSDLASRSREVWIGPAASDFEQRAADADAELKAQAALLLATAIEFESDARRRRVEAAALEAQAATDEATVAASSLVAAPGGSPPPGNVE